MTDVVIIVEETSPTVVISTTEVSTSIGIPSNSNASGASSLSALTDVSVPSPQEGQVLTFKTGLWRAEDVVDDSIKSPLDGGLFT